MCICVCARARMFHLINSTMTKSDQGYQGTKNVDSNQNYFVFSKKHNRNLGILNNSDRNPFRFYSMIDNIQTISTRYTLDNANAKLYYKKFGRNRHNRQCQSYV